MSLCRGPRAAAPGCPDRAEAQAISHRLGATILDIAKRHLGQPYEFTPTPNYDDPHWKGPFDCAEYVSYCAYRAYEIPYGVVPDPANRFNSYSGYWQRDAEKQGIKISWRDALHIPGALLLRYPPGNEPPPYGHVAISLGNGGDTYEARGKQFGVMKHTAIGRSWNTGVLIPGVLYDLPEGLGSELLLFKVLDPPAGYSPIVEEIQKRLVGLGLLAEPQVNGLYDVVTAKAVSAFQDRKGVVSDGEVGPETGGLLGLGDIWKKAPVPDKPGLAEVLPDAPTNVDAEILTLARTLYGEARGEPREGIEAVANVILNRVLSNRYPNTIAKVCLQRLQFSCWNDNDPNRKIISRLMPGDNPIFDIVLQIATRAVLGGLPGAGHRRASLSRQAGPTRAGSRTRPGRPWSPPSARTCSGATSGRRRRRPGAHGHPARMQAEARRPPDRKLRPAPGLHRADEHAETDHRRDAAQGAGEDAVGGADRVGGTAEADSGDVEKRRGGDESEAVARPPRPPPASRCRGRGHGRRRRRRRPAPPRSTAATG